MLTLTQVAELDVSAASGLVALPDGLCVVADDELFLGVYGFDGKPQRRVPLRPGVLPEDHAERKRLKPDFESLTRLPDGRLLALGSGSTAGRAGGALIDPQSWQVRALDLSVLYQALRTPLPELNVEGAAVVDGCLWLAQRGNGPSRINACVVLELAALMPQLDAHARVQTPIPFTIHPLELGMLEGVALSVTDLAAHPAGGLVFCAAAEDSADTYADGHCAGSVVGALDAHGQLRTLLPVQPRCKLEGISIARERLWLVTDPDDRCQHATLFCTPLAF